jgi:uncharacterized protein YecE (DUF72 family)
VGKAFVGISGWTYAGWRGRFYPDGLAQKRELEYAARRFNAVEINGTFYSLQRPQSFEKWREQTPRGFRFAVKGSRFITHMKQLREVETALANFFASGVLRLESRLGPFLWQFSDRMRYDRARFARFLELLPADESAAARLARAHDHRVAGRASYHTETNRRLRHALEVRHQSFMCDDFVRLLGRHRAALVFSDAGPHWPYAEDVTADFVYLRLHGAEQIYTSGYDDRALDGWARRIGAWVAGREPRGARRAGSRPAPRRAGRDAFTFFDNDAKVRAPFDAAALARRLGIDWEDRHAE